MDLSIDDRDFPVVSVFCENVDDDDEDGGYVNVRTFEEMLEEIAAVRSDEATPPPLGPFRLAPPVSPVSVPSVPLAPLSTFEASSDTPVVSRVSKGSLLWGSDGAHGLRAKTQTKIDFIAGTTARRRGGTVWVEAMTSQKEKRKSLPPNTIVFRGYNSKS